LTRNEVDQASEEEFYAYSKSVGRKERRKKFPPAMEWKGKNRERKSIIDSDGKRSSGAQNPGET